MQQPDQREVANRGTGYRTIGDIADFLDSITSQLLRILAGRESKNLPKIFTSINELPPSAKSLLKNAGRQCGLNRTVCSFPALSSKTGQVLAS